MIPDVVLLCSLEVIVAYMLVVYSFFFNLLVSCLGSLQLFPWAVHGSEAGKSIEHLWIHHVLCLHTWWFTLCVCARQLCGVYTALAEDIQGYAMSFGSNLGAPSLSLGDHLQSLGWHWHQPLILSHFWNYVYSLSQTEITRWMGTREACWPGLPGEKSSWTLSRRLSPAKLQKGFERVDNRFWNEEVLVDSILKSGKHWTLETVIYTCVQ
jgi:hypothetical protein